MPAVLPLPRLRSDAEQRMAVIEGYLAAERLWNEILRNLAAVPLRWD